MRTAVEKTHKTQTQDNSDVIKRLENDNNHGIAVPNPPKTVNLEHGNGTMTQLEHLVNEMTSSSIRGLGSQTIQSREQRTPLSSIWNKTPPKRAREINSNFFREDHTQVESQTITYESPVGTKARGDSH